MALRTWVLPKVMRFAAVIRLTGAMHEDPTKIRPGKRRHAAAGVA